MSDVFWGVWDCNKCGRTDISAKDDTCPGCRSVKGKDTVYRVGTQ